MTTTADSETSKRGAGSLDDPRLRLAFGGLLVAMFIGALDQTIMATALPTIAGQLRRSGRAVVGGHGVRTRGGRLDTGVGEGF